MGHTETDRERDAHTERVESHAETERDRETQRTRYHIRNKATLRINQITTQPAEYKTKIVLRIVWRPVRKARKY